MKTALLVVGIVLALGGLFMTWVGLPAPDDPTTPVNDPLPTDFFCIGSGVAVLALGILLSVYGFRAQPAVRYPAPYGAPGTFGPPLYGAPPPGTAIPPTTWPPAMPVSPPPPPATPEESKKCASCGQPIAATARFCNHCGAPQG